MHRFGKKPNNPLISLVNFMIKIYSALSAEALNANVKHIKQGLLHMAKGAVTPLEIALARQENFVTLQPTPEDETLWNSACKVLAQAHILAGHSNNAAKALRRVRNHYKGTLETAKVELGTAVIYPAMNLLAAEFATEHDSPLAATEQKMQKVQKVRNLEIEQYQYQRQPDFWSAVALTEITGSSALIKRKLEERQDLHECAFQDLYNRAPDLIGWTSVLDQTGFPPSAYLKATDSSDTELASRRSY
jgi:hypothetical protein